MKINLFYFIFYASNFGINKFKICKEHFIVIHISFNYILFVRKAEHSRAAALHQLAWHGSTKSYQNPAWSVWIYWGGSAGQPGHRVGPLQCRGGQDWHLHRVVQAHKGLSEQGELTYLFIHSDADLWLSVTGHRVGPFWDWAHHEEAEGEDGAEAHAVPLHDQVLGWLCRRGDLWLCLVWRFRMNIWHWCCTQ